MKMNIKYMSLLTTLVVTSVNFSHSFKEVKADNDISFSITTNIPKTGSPIETTYTGISEEVTYRWFINDVEIENKEASYTPTASDYESFIECKLCRDNGSTILSDKIYFSPIPVVYLSTNDATEILNREDYQEGTIEIQGCYDNDFTYSGETEIKGRGTSSWHYDKKPYKLKLGKKADLFGFGKSKHYVLLANYLDPSTLRNNTGYNVGKEFGLVGTDAQYVDLVFNGEYAGNYQLVEHIRVGSNLIDIFDYEGFAGDAASAIYKANKSTITKDESKDLEDLMVEDLSWLTTDTVLFNEVSYKVSDYITLPTSLKGGVLLEFGTDYADEVTHFETNDGIKVMVSKPEYLNTNDSLYNFTKDYLNEFENAIDSITGYSSKGHHYTELADIDSMVGYWLTMEICGNEDAATRSRYAYIPVDGKLTFGPVWDFDIGSDSPKSALSPVNSWIAVGCLTNLLDKQDIYKNMIDDPYFQIKSQEAFKKILPYLNELVMENGILYHEVERYYESIAANEIRWTGLDNKMQRPATGNMGDIATYCDWMRQRVNWLTNVFKTEDTTTSAMKLSSSNNSFDRSENIKLSINSLEKGDESYYLDSLKDVTINCELTDSTSGTLYVNGIKVATYSNIDLQNGVILSSSYLTEDVNDKNVIEIISNINGKYERNYITLIIDGPKEEGYISKIHEDYCENNNHKLVKISYREKTTDRYGIEECYYCDNCHHYFSIEEENTPLFKYQVIDSPRSKNVLIAENPVNLGVIILMYLLIFFVASLITLSIPAIIVIRKVRRQVRCK